MLMLRKSLICKIIAMLFLCGVALAAIPVTEAHAAGKGTVIFTFDDGSAGQFNNAFPILNAAGFKATAYINSENIGGDWMTVAQLQALYSAGWDISDHTADHEEIGSYTDDAHLAQAKADYDACRSWIISHGFGNRGENEVAYPSGVYTRELEDLLINDGFHTARCTDYGFRNEPVTSQAEYFSLPVYAVSSNYPLDECENGVDKAASTGGTVIFMLHKVEATPGDLTTTIADLTTFVNYVKTKVTAGSVSVMTMSQWYAAQSLSARVPATPPAPAILYDDVANTVSGLTQIMEYKLDNAASYVPYTAASFNLDLSGNHTLKVRYAAVGIDLPGLDTTINFTQNTDLVTFVSNGGSDVPSVLTPNNATMTAPTDPTLPGYSFAGWFKDPLLQNKWDFSSDKVTADMTLYAKWTINNYTVTFNDNGTVLTQYTQHINYGGYVIEPRSPSHTGYNFISWCTDQDGQDAWDFSKYTVAADTTLYAYYTPINYTVTFLDHTGAVIQADTQYLDFGTLVTKPSDPDFTGHKFINWCTDAGHLHAWDFTKDVVAGNTTLYPNYQINTYKVSFIGYGGVAIDDDQQSVDYGGYVSAPTDPDHTGYSFKGWYKEPEFQNPWIFANDTVTADTTIYAKFTINTYKVTFEDWNGDQIGADQYIKYGSDAIKPQTDPTREGYTFTGWSPDYQDITADTTVVAQYDINYYTVDFVDGDGHKLCATQSVAYNDAAIAPTDTNAPLHYHFTRWDLPFDKVSSNMTITAKYDIDSFTVTFKDYDGGLLKQQTVDYGSSATAPDSPDNYLGYHFIKWDLPFGNITADLTVTAVYDINFYTVKFVNKGGAVLATQSIKYNEAATAPDDPTYTGWTFTGWDPAKFDHVTSDMTITAQYTCNGFDVTFVSWNGEVIAKRHVGLDQAATEPTAQEWSQVTPKPGYTFNGNWDRAFDDVTSDMTVKALYTINQYTVTFVYKNANGEDVQKQVVVDYNTAAAEPPDAKRAGYTLKWSPPDFTHVKSNMTVTASYTLNYYTVTFMGGLDGTTVLKTQTKVYYHTAANPPSVPVIPGYAFAKWDTDYSSITSDLTVTAQYNKTYTVTFVDINGNTLVTQTVITGTDAKPPAAPKITGYTFVKWSPDYTNVTQDLTVKATYTINTYSVTFNSEGGSAVAGMSAVYYSLITAPAVPVYAGHTFVGWYKQAAYTTAWNFATDKVLGNTILYAKWTTNTYTVTFNSEGGSAVAGKSALYSSLITAPAAPVYAGHTFVGWYKQAAYTTAWNFATDKVLGNTILYAKWTTATKFTVTVLTNSATYGTVTGGGAYFNDNVTKAMVTAVPKAGYRFVRWLEGTTAVSTSYQYSFLVTRARTLTAVFAAITKPVITVTSAGATQINITWAAATGAVGYEVYRSTTSGGTYTKIASPTAATYTDTGLKTNTTYYYEVRVKCTAGTVVTYGAFSVVKSAKPVAA